MLQLSMRGARPVGVDIETMDLLRARDMLRAFGCEYDLVRADVKLLPFRDLAFDSALCVEVLQYVDDDRACLKELQRVLLTGGRLVVSVPNIDFPILYDPLNWVRARLGASPVRVGIWFWGDQLRLYARKNLLDRMAGVGLRVLKVRFVGAWLVPLVESYFSSLLYSLTPSSEKPSYIKKGSIGPRRPHTVRGRLYSFSGFLSLVADLDEQPGVPIGTHILVSATRTDQAHR